MSKSQSKPSAVDQAVKAAQEDERAAQQQASKARQEHIKLDAQNATLTNQVQTLESMIQTRRLVVSKLDEEVRFKEAALVEVDRVTRLRKEETEKVETALTEVETQLEARKQSIDAELEQYETEQKQRVKTAILMENTQLTAVRTEKAALDAQIETKLAELKEISDLYAKELEDSRASTAERDRIIAENAEAVVSSSKIREEAEKVAAEAVYERDSALRITEKARDEHKKFLEYETKARKILETKDQVLQAQAAEIQQANQMIANRRSFLPEL